MRSRIMLSTAMLVMLALPAAAATMAPHKGGVATGATVAPGETVEERIANLHTELRITPSEEGRWAKVAQAMRDNATAMQKMVTDKQAQNAENLTAKQDLKNYQEFAQAHVDGLKNLRSAFDSLYDFMPDAQRQVADQVFRDSKHQQ